MVVLVLLHYLTVVDVNFLFLRYFIPYLFIVSRLHSTCIEEVSLLAVVPLHPLEVISLRLSSVEHIFLMNLVYPPHSIPVTGAHTDLLMILRAFSLSFFVIELE